jgi:hypothetical protein
VIWEKMHDERPGSLVVDPSGDVVLTGTKETRTNSVTSYKTLIGKYSRETGSVLWEKRGFQPGVSHWQAAVNVGGDVIIVGADSAGGGSTDIYLGRLRGSDGESVSETRFATNADDIPYAIALDAAGDTFVGGSSGGKFFLAKFREDGRFLWKQEHDNPPNSNPGWGSYVGAILVDGRGNVTAVGNLERNLLTAKYSGRDGTLLWERVYSPGIEHTSLNRVSVDLEGNVLVSSVYRNMQTFHLRAVYLVKYGATDGTTKWEKRIGGKSMEDEVVGMNVDDTGNVVLGLISPAMSSRNRPVVYIGKLAGSDGTVVWEFILDDFWAGGLTMDGEGRIAVTGRKDFDFTTLLFRDELPARLNVAGARGGMLEIRWPELHKGLRLETQSGEGISANREWTAVAGSTGTNAVTVPIETGGRAGFFRLVRE